MKKALSVLLVVAALFGFYGSAVTVNDLLACKDYWEEAGEKSTADMNKLEDGLNQLKDNEQAYLDGLQQVADGEVALADGEAQYAQGLADYAAAPAKLADARRQIADGEDQLAEGKKSLDGLTQLIKGISDIRKNYKSWKKGYDALHENRQKLVGGLDTVMDEDGHTLKDTLLGLAGNLDEQTAAVYTAAIDGLDDSNQSANGYKTFAQNAATVAAVVDGMVSKLEESKEGADNIVNACSNNYPGTETPMITAALNNPETAESTEAGIRGILAAAGYSAQQADDLVAGAKDGDANAIGSIKAAASGVSATLEENIGSLNALQSAYTNNLKAFAAAVNENIDTLEGGQDALAAGVATVASAVLGNKTLKDGVQSNFGSSAITLLNAYSSKNGPLSTSMTSFAGFETQMDSNPGIDGFLEQAQNLLAKTKAEGLQTYYAGKKKLDSGKAQYKQGLADYAAAPGKLADAEQQLADGRKQLEDGKAQLAQYEDGEQQIRDGLATLFNTEADLDLVSIADRLNGDGDFDNGDKHLEIEEGLNAVEVGRGYQAEDGDLITTEIMGRAVATGGLLAAGVLAVLAAILSFLKKNKAAGVFALLAAAAGAFGAFYGPAQGTYFSEIAGSTIGTLTWVAAGVLGAVALVHAIAHFAAPKNA